MTEIMNVEGLVLRRIDVEENGALKIARTTVTMSATEVPVPTVHTTQIGMNMREGAKKIVGFQMETTKAMTI